MKHSDFFKALAVLGSCLLLLTVSCSKHDEIAFKGVVIDARQCTLTSSGTLPQVGYFVNLESPDSIGKPYSTDNATYPNVIILYEPDCRIYKNDHIKGAFYLDNKFSRTNCAIHWSDLDLPEGVFTSVSVE